MAHDPEGFVEYPDRYSCPGNIFYSSLVFFVHVLPSCSGNWFSMPWMWAVESCILDSPRGVFAGVASESIYLCHRCSGGRFLHTQIYPSQGDDVFKEMAAASFDRYDFVLHLSDDPLLPRGTSDEFLQGQPDQSASQSSRASVRTMCELEKHCCSPEMHVIK